ncbi:MAG: hypothetical protein FK733_07405 [Asgard group archaeon]|nr:hypothetical protein [Asgard group archaeon]
MSKKINCPNCAKKIDDFSVYCEFCGQVIQKDKVKKQTVYSSTKTEIKPSPIPPISTPPSSKETTEKPDKDRKWYQRFFSWCGREITLYFKWLCCCNICRRPEDLDD